MAVYGSLIGTGAAAPLGEVTGVDGFYHQIPDWRPCGDDALDQAGAQCADVTVPLNYAEPQGDTITIAISRIPAAEPDRRHGILMSNPGGPGVPALDFTMNLKRFLPSDVLDRYDLIGMDPRGVGRSAPVNCRWPIGSWIQSAGTTLTSFAESVATQADLAARCLTSRGPAIRHITTRNTARDMDVIRGVLGEPSLSYYGGSYGTYLGAVFTQMFPDRSDRFVFDSAADPARYGVAMFQDLGAPNEAALDAWAEWVSARNDEYRLGTNGSEIRNRATALIEQSGRQPIRLGNHQIDDHWLATILLDTIADPRQWGLPARILRQVTDAANGAIVQPDTELAQELGHLLNAEPADESAQSAVFCGDAAAPRDPSWYWRNIETSRATQPIFGPLANNISPCAFWPPPLEPPTAVHNSVPALILQATGDTRTAYNQGVGLHQALTASRMITLLTIIHGVITVPSTCAHQPVYTYLRDGTLPTTDLTCRPD